jgi:hypothetical protein
VSLLSEQPYDWLRFWIHFVCGAIFGAGIGFFFWVHNWSTGSSSWFCIAIPSLIVALLGGIYGDRFWEGFLRAIGRWGWWM